MRDSGIFLCKVIRFVPKEFLDPSRGIVTGEYLLQGSVTEKLMDKAF